MSLTAEDSKNLIELMAYLKEQGIHAATINWGMTGKDFAFQVVERGGKVSYFRKDVDHFVRI